MATKLFKINFLAILLLMAVCSKAQTLQEQKQNFVDSKNEIELMLNGKVLLSFERTVFITENPFYSNANNFAAFKENINFHLDNIKLIAKQIASSNSITTKPNKLVSKDSAQKNVTNAVNNYAIFKYLTDTTYFIFDSTVYYNPSFKYASSDPFATINWQTSQVTTLLNFNKYYGNCNALVSLYKIFAERLNSNVIVCTAPSHIFIRHGDENGIFYNVELASKSFPGTGSLETITYTTDQAARSGIAMRELNLKQSIALQLINLAKAYQHKFNSKTDDFILNCANLCLQYDSLNLNAMLLKAEYYNTKITNLNKPINQLKTNPHFIAYQKQINQLYQLGYRQMPTDMKNKIISNVMQDSTYLTFAKNQTYMPFPSKTTYTNSYSLSNGLFEEVNSKKPTEQFFNTVYNTKTKKITAFKMADNLYNNYDIDPVVFALSIDPLAAKMPYYSPYSAFGNNPIIYVDNDGRENIIYLVYLPSKDCKITKQDAQDMANKANENFKNLGLNTRVVLADEKVTGSKNFNPSKIDKTDAVAVIGNVSDVTNYIKKVGGNDAGFIEGWKGGEGKEPERSENKYNFDYGGVPQRGGGKFIAIDGNAIKDYANANGWTETEAGGQILNHGAGHNADLDGKLQHNESGIMMDGQERQRMGNTYTDYKNTTSGSRNTKYSEHIKSRFKEKGATTINGTKIK